jgi:hypothetical protein
MRTIRDADAYYIRRQRLMAFIKAHPCHDCGREFPGVCMDFDHRDPETKAGSVSKMAVRAKIPALLAEIAKCDLVCANCHRLRTWESDRTLPGRRRQATCKRGHNTLGPETRNLQGNCRECIKQRNAERRAGLR